MVGREARHDPKVGREVTQGQDVDTDTIATRGDMRNQDVIPDDVADSFAGKRVLIAGGLGFIGSNLARALVSLGSRVAILDSLVPEHGGSMRNIADLEHAIEVHVADVRDESPLSDLIGTHEVLFNLVGQTSHLDSMDDPYTDLELNCRSQLAILEMCRRFNRDVKIVYASTRQIYGRPQYLPVDEQHPVLPVDVNGINKMAGEAYHFLYGNAYGIRVSSLRLTNTFGPRMRVKDARQTFLGYWFRLLLERQPLPIFGDGTQVRDYCYVDDAVRALLTAAAREEAIGEVYNLGGERVTSHRDLAELLVELNGGGSYHLIPFPPDRRAIDIGDYYADYTKIRDHLGWQPIVRLEDGLARTLKFFRRHGMEYGVNQA